MLGSLDTNVNFLGWNIILATVKRGNNKYMWEHCPGWSPDDLTDRNKTVYVPYHAHYKCV